MLHLLYLIQRQGCWKFHVLDIVDSFDIRYILLLINHPFRFSRAVNHLFWVYRSNLENATDHWALFSTESFVPYKVIWVCRTRSDETNIFTYYCQYWTYRRPQRPNEYEERMVPVLCTAGLFVEGSYPRWITLAQLGATPKDNTVSLASERTNTITVKIPSVSPEKHTSLA
jgi:hypothetical protein